MVELDDRTVDELEAESETMLVGDFVRVVETYHPEGGPGASREALDAYAEALDYDVEQFRERLADRLSDAEAWVDDETVYEVGEGRVSAYPPDWHRRFVADTDLVEVVRTISEQTGEKAGAPEELVVRAMEAVTGAERDHVEHRLRKLEHAGELNQYPSQHPNSRLEVDSRENTY